MAANFETLIEHIVSGNTEKARAIFHKIVVDKSRKIYEDLDVDRAFDDVDTDHVGFDAEDEIGGDAVDDFQSDVEVDADTMGDESDVNLPAEERISDAETEIDGLQAQFAELEKEFNELMSKQEGSSDDESFDDESEDESFGDESEDADETLDSAEDEFEEEESEVEAEDSLEDEDNLSESLLQEYVLSVTKDLPSDKEAEGVQKKSPIADKRPKLNGVDARNIAQGGDKAPEKKPEVKDMVSNEEIQNRPGRKTVTLKKVSKPSEKEGKGINTKSVEA